MTRRAWWVVALAGTVVVLALVTALFRHQRGVAALDQASQRLARPVGVAPELADLDAAEALVLLERARSNGVQLRRLGPLLGKARALLALQQGDLVAAERHLRHSEAKWGWSAELGWLSAELAHRRGDQGAALKELERTLAHSPEYSRARLLRSDLALDQGEGEVAARDMQMVIAKNPSSPGLHNRMALCEELRGDDVKAAYHLRRALAHDPSFVDAWVNLGRLHHRQRRWAQAFEAYSNALAYSPTSSDALLGRGLVCVQYFEAPCLQSPREDLERAAELAERDPAPREALGDWHRLRGELPQALASYRSAVDLAEGNPQSDHQAQAVAWLKLGNALVAAGKLALADAAFESAIKRNPSLAAAHNGLGAVLLGLGRVDEALPVLERAAELDPDDPNPRELMALAAEGSLARRPALRN